jgi:hypothetical protein
MGPCIGYDSYDIKGRIPWCECANVSADRLCLWPEALNKGAIDHRDRSRLRTIRPLDPSPLDQPNAEGLKVARGNHHEGDRLGPSIDGDRGRWPAIQRRPSGKGSGGRSRRGAQCFLEADGEARSLCLVVPGAGEVQVRQEHMGGIDSRLNTRCRPEAPQQGAHTN